VQALLSLSFLAIGLISIISNAGKSGLSFYGRHGWLPEFTRSNFDVHSSRYLFLMLAIICHVKGYKLHFSSDYLYYMKLSRI